SKDLDIREEIGANLVGLHVDSADSSHEKLMSQLLHSCGSPGIKSEGIGSCSLVLLENSLLVDFLRILSSGSSPSIGNLSKIVIGNHGKGVLHEVLPKSLEEFIFQNIDGIALPIAAIGQSNSVDVDRDLTSILGHHTGSHRSGHFGEKINCPDSEKTLVGVLSLIAQNLDDLFHSRVVLNILDINHE